MLVPCIGNSPISKPFCVKLIGEVQSERNARSRLARNEMYI